MAIEKDPELVRALIAKGQILCSQGSLVEAAKYFENAISKVNYIASRVLLIVLHFTVIYCVYLEISLLHLDNFFPRI